MENCQTIRVENLVYSVVYFIPLLLMECEECVVQYSGQAC